MLYIFKKIPNLLSTSISILVVFAIFNPNQNLSIIYNQ